MDTHSPQPSRPCPICGAPAVAAHKPFCSKRCADVDLNRWLSGVYRVPTDETYADPDRGPTDDQE
jgi:uncharacterized protein